jgi:hypothetical protein
VYVVSSLVTLRETPLKSLLKSEEAGEVGGALGEFSTGSIEGDPRIGEVERGRLVQDETEAGIGDIGNDGGVSLL